MSAYLLSVVGTVLFSAILTAILPEGRSLGMVKSMAKLACTLTIISPIFSFFNTGLSSFFVEENSYTIFSESVIQAEKTFIEYYSELRTQETEALLEKVLFEKYAIQTEVTLVCENLTERVDGFYEVDKMKVVGIIVKLKQETKEEVLRNIWEYLTENYCSEVVIE